MTCKMEDKTNGMQDYEDDLSWVLAQSTENLEKSVDVVIVSRRVDIITRMCTWGMRWSQYRMCTWGKRWSQYS
jgi:hypothetical protein